MLQQTALTECWCVGSLWRLFLLVVPLRLAACCVRAVGVRSPHPSCSACVNSKREPRPRTHCVSGGSFFVRPSRPVACAGGMLRLVALGAVIGALGLSYFTFVAPLRNVPSVLLFDGVCVLCNNFVRFVGAHDSRNLVHFASLQSRYGRDSLKEHELPPGERVVWMLSRRSRFDVALLCADYLRSVVVLQNGHAYTGSDAVMRLFATLDSPYHVLGRRLCSASSLALVHAHTVAHALAVHFQRRYTLCRARFVTSCTTLSGAHAIAGSASRTFVWRRRRGCQG